MIKVLIGLAFWTVALGAESAIAAPSFQVARADDCARFGSNVETKQCLRERYEQADRELNQVYKEIKSGQSAEEKELLTDAQVAWITYRDQGCAFETYRRRKGTGYRGFLSECLERMTRARTAELKRYGADR
jgi:uncharacterized protein YecT (DUF1311 family)